VRGFIEAPYYRLSDVRMGAFFVEMGGFAAAILALFFAGYLAARATGAWDNGISDEEYRFRLGHEAVELYVHPR
jgi:hypothetical protein